MNDYTLLVSWQALQFLERLPPGQRKRLRDRCVAICGYPANFSDYRETDHTGRYLDVHVCGRHAILYWEDFTDRHLKILEIRNADR